MTEIVTPIHKGEPDSPARLLAGLTAEMSRLQAEELEVLRVFVDARDKADEHARAATTGLDEVAGDLEKVEPDTEPSAE